MTKETINNELQAVPGDAGHGLFDIIKQHSAQLKGFIRKRVSSIEDSEDILQDVFYQLVKADALLKPIDQMTAWLYSVTRNKITDWYRKKKTENLSVFGDGELTEVSRILFNDKASTPEDEHLRSKIWDELEKALAELPAEQRDVFEKNELLGIPFNDISEDTGVSVNTLLSRKRYAVLHLRKRLKQLYDDLT